jgi:putative phosphoesterase
MKVGIIADTHDNLTAIAEAVEIFNDADIELLIHAGDFISPFTSQPFKNLNAPLIGVFGNNDGDKLLLKEYYESSGVGELYEDPYVFEFAVKKIVVTHKPQIVKSLAISGVYDAVLYGHTHKAVIEQQHAPVNNGGRQGTKTWVINPGECCGYLTGRKTVALLDFEKAKARIIDL